MSAALISLFESLGMVLIHTLWQGLLIGFFTWIICCFDHRPAWRYNYFSGALFLVGITFFVNLIPAFWPFLGFAVFQSENGSITGNEGIFLITEQFPSNSAIGILSIFSLMWIGGILIFAIRLIYKLRRHRKWIQQHVEVLSSKDVNYLHNVVGFTHTRYVRIAQHLTSPAVSGWVKPVIMLPAGYMLQWPPDQLYALLLHEWYHLRRKDHWILLLQQWMEVILFFHPVIWWLNRNIHTYREIAVDDEVMKEGTDKFTYAKALYQSALGFVEASRFSISATGQREQLLHQRIERILFKDKNPMNMRSTFILLIALFLSLSIVTGVSLNSNLSATNYTPFYLLANTQDTIPETNSGKDPLLKSADMMRNRLEQLSGHASDTTGKSESIDSVPRGKAKTEALILKLDTTLVIYNTADEKTGREAFVFQYREQIERDLHQGEGNKHSSYIFSAIPDFDEFKDDLQIVRFYFPYDSLPHSDHHKIREQIQQEMAILRKNMEEQREAMLKEREALQQRMPEIRRKAMEEARISQEEIREIRQKALEESRMTRVEVREIQQQAREAAREARMEAMEQMRLEREALRALQMEHQEEMRRIMEEIKETLKESRQEQEKR